MNIRNVKLRFNLDKKNDRKAYEYLQNTEKSYSKAVISVICDYLDLSEKVASEDAFLERIIETIRKESGNLNSFGNLLQLAQTQQPQQAQRPLDESVLMDENTRNVLEFLDCL